jgi:tRNA threonylcarbamoyladenosine biosynthesis protein TsaB
MRILGISSATRVISIGLIEGEKMIIETTVADLRAEKVVNYIKAAGIEPEKIEGVAVAIGPGSYSGLRGGLATAKTLAQTIKVPLLGVSTLEAIAYNLVDSEGAIAVILDARLDEYNFALFGSSGGKLKRLTDDLVFKLERLLGLLEKISGKLFLAGNLSEVRGKISKPNLCFSEEINAIPFGVNVAKLGLMRFEKGESDDPLKLAPHYSHRPVFREFSR